MTDAQTIEILTKIEFRDWGLLVSPDIKYIQWYFNGQRGRKWLLSEHMTESEIVQTALLGVLTALEHEAREGFRYKGADTFSPHINVNEVNKLRLRKALDDILA